MANTYPHIGSIGNSTDYITIHHSDNQSTTPPCQNPAVRKDKGFQVHSSLKATASICMLLLLFVLLPNIGWGQDCAYTTATIGSSTDNKSFEYSPVNNYYNYGYRQIIYDASELCGDGISCVIHKIAFHYAGSRTMSEKGDVRIYMAEVDRAAFTGNNNWEAFANFTEVYRGSLNCAGNSGWNWFTLNRSFNFSGDKHLIVAIWDNSGGYDAGGNNDNNRNRYGFYSTACTGNKMLYKDQYGSAVNRNNPGNGTRTARRPNTKFCVDCCSNSYSMSSTPLCFDFSDYAYPSAYGNVYSGLPACWSTIYNGQEVVDDDNDHVSGRGHIYSESARLIGMWAGYFDGYVQVNYGRYGYVILPSISGVTAGDVVSFDAFMTSNTNGTLTVGYMSDRNNANTFTVFYTAQNYTSQHSYECTIPAGWNNNSVLAFRWEYNSNTDAAGVFIDNICIIHVVEPGSDDCEGFETGNLHGWTTTGDGTWFVDVGDYSTATGTHSGSYNALITHEDYDYQTYLISPSMDLSGEAGAVLSFWYVNREWSGDIDELTVYYRVNGGGWIELFHTGTAHETWTEQTIELPGLVANYQIAFMMTDNYGYGIGIDDVCITPCTPSTATLEFSPDNGSINIGSTIDLRSPTLTNTTGQSVQWSTNGNAASFDTPGVVRGLDEGNVTITVSVAPWLDGSTLYCPMEATFSLEINAYSCDYNQQIVGNDASTNIIQFSPLYYYYGNNYNQIIYTHDEVCPSGGDDNMIYSIAFKYSTSNETTWKNDVIIFMGKTTKTRFDNTGDWITSGLEQVYRGPLNNSGESGWKWIALNNAYHFDGNDNLVVAIMDISNNYGGSANTAQFYYTSTTENTVLYWYNDNNQITDETNPGRNASAIISERPLTKFCLECGSTCNLNATIEFGD